MLWNGNTVLTQSCYISLTNQAYLLRSRSPSSQHMTLVYKSIEDLLGASYL